MTVATKAPPDSLFASAGLELPAFPDFRFEDEYWRTGCRHVAGVDEAGRGPLAGPVVAAAVILDREFGAAGLTDSKKLSAKARDKLYEAIMRDACAVSVAGVCAVSIDGSDIRKASLLAMKRAVAGLATAAETALYDGRDIPPDSEFPFPPRAIVKGDNRSLSIAAASVVAKVTRDRMMTALGTVHPEYGFEKHMGYGAARHRATIGRIGGAARVHRFSFRPLRREE
jgi:ribonuclease HII